MYLEKVLDILGEEISCNANSISEVKNLKKDKKKLGLIGIFS